MCFYRFAVNKVAYMGLYLTARQLLRDDFVTRLTLTAPTY